MSTDFSFLSQAAVTDDDVAEYTLPVRFPNGENPVLVGRFAGESNRAFFNAQRRQVLAITAKLKGRTAADVDADLKAEARAVDAQLLGEHVLTGWRHVCDVDGAPADYSKADGVRFLRHIAKHMPDVFDNINRFFSDPSNFRDLDFTLDDGAVLETGND